MNELGKKLADAWIKKDLIEIKSTDLPKNRKESHLIQKEFHKVLNKKTVGWKIGMVTKSLQDGAKVDGPMIGKIIDETVLINPLKIDYGKVPHCILECEFALKFLEDTANCDSSGVFRSSRLLFNSTPHSDFRVSLLVR